MAEIDAPLGYKEKYCQECKLIFKPTSGNQLFCGEHRRVAFKSKRNCNVCGAIIYWVAKRCYACLEFTTPKYKELYEERKKTSLRNKVIVQQLDSGNYTLQSIGTKYGLTRERIRQIYNANSKKHYSGVLCRRRDERSKKMKKISEEILNLIKFKCVACGKSVTYAEGKYKRIFCVSCKLIVRKNRNPKVICKCETCGKNFHPFRNAFSPNIRIKSKFCSQKCYLPYSPYRKEILKELIGEGVVNYENF